MPKVNVIHSEKNFDYKNQVMLKVFYEELSNNGENKEEGKKEVAWCGGIIK